MPKRSYSAAGSYRYGFNGKENDNDVKGLGNQQDYGMRIYDPRVGRFLSTDPLAQSFPWYTPYQFAGNKPIWAVDLDGLEEFIVTKEYYKNGSIKKITIQYTVTKETPKAYVNFRFKEVLGKNDDGSSNTGDPLTSKKVIRIFIKAKGIESFEEDDKLNPEEKSIIKQNSQNEEDVNSDHELWDLTIGRKLYLSETSRNTDKMSDIIAERKYNLIKDLNPEQNFGNMFLIGPAEYFSHNGKIIPNGSFIGSSSFIEANEAAEHKFNLLMSDIKEDGGIKSATITWNFYAGGANNTASARALIRKGVDKAADYLKSQLNKAGVRKVKMFITEVKDVKEDSGAKISLGR